MAAGKWKVYDLAKQRLADGTFDMDNAALGLTMALFQSTSNCNTLNVGTGLYGDLTNEVASANGYTTGGIALTNEVWTNSSGTITFDCDDVTWNASGGSITARFAVIYCNATVNSIVKPLLCVSLLNTTPADETATTGNPFTIQINAGGVFTLSGATVD
jgi:hypothetical protein